MNWPIVLRTVKGSALTYGEEDGNFQELDRRTAAGKQNLRGQIDLSGVVNPPTMSAYNGVPLMSFSADTVQLAPVRLHLPHDYVAGTSITPHGHVLTSTASAGVVRWGFTFLWANEYDDADVVAGPPTADQKFQSLGTAYVEQVLSANDQDVHRVVSSPVPISLPLLKPDAVILMTVFRDSAHINDTYPDPMFLTYVDMYYQSQGFGTAGY